MVTGVETAGLVLAAIPLLISAAEHYKQGLHPLKAILRKRYELERFYRALDEQKTVLRLSLIELFGQDADKLSEEQLAALQDPQNDLETLWTDTRLQDSVKDRLGLAYAPYLNNIALMRSALEKLLNQKCLHLASSAKVRLDLSSPHVTTHS
jgi:hypothetical protein